MAGSDERGQYDTGSRIVNLATGIIVLTCSGNH
jgi:hypothetical protein